MTSGKGPQRRRRHWRCWNQSWCHGMGETSKCYLHATLGTMRYHLHKRRQPCSVRQYHHELNVPDSETVLAMRSVAKRPEEPAYLGPVGLHDVSRPYPTPILSYSNPNHLLHTKEKTVAVTRPLHRLLTSQRCIRGGLCKVGSEHGEHWRAIQHAPHCVKGSCLVEQLVLSR